MFEDLPLRALINNIEYELFNDDAGLHREYTDLVKCNWCNRFGYIELGANICPNCERNGLEDIQPADIVDE